MREVWNTLGISIPDLVQCKIKDSELWIEGIGSYATDTWTSGFRWSAHATPAGWFVQIAGADGVIKGSMQGATFNLWLEVAAIARKIL